LKNPGLTAWRHFSIEILGRKQERFKSSSPRPRTGTTSTLPTTRSGTAESVAHRWWDSVPDLVPVLFVKQLLVCFLGFRAQISNARKHIAAWDLFKSRLLSENDAF